VKVQVGGWRDWEGGYIQGAKRKNS